MAYEELSINTHELDGLAELLYKFPLETQQKLLRPSLGAGAAVFMVGVMERTPVRTDEKTGGSTSLAPGLLKADIHAVASKSGRAWYIGAGTLTAHVMRWLERGHMIVHGGQGAWTNGKRSRKGTGKTSTEQVPAYPILRPTFDAMWRTALRATAMELQNRIADYWQKTLKRVGKAA